MQDLLEIERRHCFDYFYCNFSKEELTYGLMPDRIPDISDICSVAANAFMLAAMAVGVDFGYIPREEAEDICIRTLKTYRGMEREQGFYYHFYHLSNKCRAHKCELSLIDSALFFAGALTAGAYFGGETLKLARELFNDCNWEYFYSYERKMFRMAKYDTGFTGYWDCYAEQLIVYFLAAASPKGRAIAPEAYRSFMRLQGEYGGHPFIYSWFGSLFTHQYSHAFLDFRGYKDGEGVDWFANSVQATLANRQFCIDNAVHYTGYGENSWGLTSCVTSKGYLGHIGAVPSGNGNSENLSEGTIAPAGALGSVVFTPEQSLCALDHFYKIQGLVKEFGLTDSFNSNRNWVCDCYISIDKGITLLMSANYTKGTIWNSFCSLNEIKKSFQVLGFKKEN